MKARRGFWVFVLIVVLFGISMALYSWTARPTTLVRPSKIVLRFDAPSSLEESAPPSGAFALDVFRRNRMTVWDVVHGLRRAAHDDAVRSVVIHVDGIDWGWAKIADVRSALCEFRAAGKPIYASWSGGGEPEYLLASVADRVAVPPTVAVQLDGLEMTTMYFRGGLDKLGVSPNFASVGKYKAAVEAYTRTRASDPARASLEGVLDETYSLLVDTLAASRGMSPDTLRARLEGGPWDAAEARSLGLIDTVLHVDDLDSLAMRRAGTGADMQSLTRYVDGLDEPVGAPHLAMVVASGAIAGGRSRESATDGRIVGAESLIEDLRAARERSSVRAIILRIDSPGGDADAADAIWREVQRCRQAKPVVVSMSDYAASGGYYIAMGGAPIIAQPATLTGSIGVFGGKFNVAGLFAKLGLGLETYQRGAHAGMWSPFEDFTPEEAALYQRHLERFYQLFLGRVAAGRHMATADVDSVAQGRVWTGLAAKPRGLVDHLGGIEEAIAEARIAAHLKRGSDVVLDLYPRDERRIWQRAFAGWFDDPDESALARALPPELRTLAAAAQFPAGSVLALMPFTIRIR
ncbi:MAG TPA: signal peptide peptidase SppA [Candidatus Saccharimonadaceae bacterium]|jgi:protease-4|nr:signal peptide peptidase SppA [Candidatus Saccharimonadaceae bacterium]